MEAKLEASKELSQYIDQLNISLEEKRVVFQMARKGQSSNRHDPPAENYFKLGIGTLTINQAINR